MFKSFLGIKFRKCPYCGVKLDKPPSKKEECPYCHNIIHVRDGELVTEDEALIRDWLRRLEEFGITRQVFNQQREKLSKRFNHTASINDTIWNILNNLIVTQTKPFQKISIYSLMAELTMQEGKDPTPYFTEKFKLYDKERILLGNEEIKYIHYLRKHGRTNDAETILLMAIPSPAVADELRKISSERAHAAKDKGDWKMVIEYLEAYNRYANKHRAFCVKLVNQEPPPHTARDQSLLAEAKRMASKK